MPHMRQPSESDEQKALFQWAAMQTGIHPELQLLHHIPNGGRRDPREAHNLRLQGVKPGVPDICLPVPRGGFHALYIELKRKGGRLSDEQRAWLNCLTANGYKAECCAGFDAAIAVITEYLESGK